MIENPCGWQDGPTTLLKKESMSGFQILQGIKQDRDKAKYEKAVKPLKRY